MFHNRAKLILENNKVAKECEPVRGGNISSFPDLDQESGIYLNLVTLSPHALEYWRMTIANLHVKQLKLASFSLSQFAGLTSKIPMQWRWYLEQKEEKKEMQGAQSSFAASV